MTTTMPLPRTRTALVAVMVARAVLAAALAAVATFTRDHNPVFGLVLLGAFALAQAAVLAAGVPAAPSREGRLLWGARAAVSAVAGVLALTSVGSGLTALFWIEVVLFLLLGLLEVVGGVRRTDGTPVGDAVVVGGLTALVGVMLVVLDRDAVLSVGVLAAWGAIVAVYLGIAAASVRRAASR